LRETLHRRLGLAMLVIASLAAVLQIPLSLVTEAGKTYAISGRSHIPVAEYVAMRFESTAMVTNNIWTLVALFAVAPLLASHLEKGWAELLFAKGVTRWQIVTARLGAALTTWAVLLSVMAIFPNLLLAWRTGTPVKAFLVMMALATFSFVAYLSVMFLVSSGYANVALLAAIAFIQAALSTALTLRKSLYEIITWRWAQWLIDWAYRILPKNADIVRAGSVYLRSHRWDGWWPIWTTAVFILVAGAIGYWRFQHKPL
jgi:ABC-type transport system involved in multi-copper enzyme maturation permease subunit